MGVWSLLLFIHCVSYGFTPSSAQNPIAETDNNDIDDIQPKRTSREIYDKLKITIESIRKSCGQVCDTSKTGTPGKYFNKIEKTIDCDALFANPDIDAPGDFHDAPRKPPKWLAPEYTYGGQVPIQYSYRDDVHLEKRMTNWTLALMDHYIKGKKHTRLYSYVVRYSAHHPIIAGTVMTNYLDLMAERQLRNWINMSKII